MKPRKPVFVALLAALLAALCACRSQPPDPSAGAQAPPSSAPTPSASAVASVDAGTSGADASVAEAPASDEKLEGTNYVKEVRAAFRIAACAGDDAWIPEGVDRKIVDAHCAQLTPGFADYKKEWLSVAMPFIAKLRPANLPTTVVYPFGGGDLVSALATFPDGLEFTTISLEIAGDVRPVLKADNKRIEKDLATLRDHLGRLFLKAHSRTVNLDIETRGAIPGEVGFTMAALAIHGFEPTALRYFSFNPDGSLKWLTDDDLAKADKDKSRAPFSNMEIRFKKPGDKQTRVLRHVAYDLSDANLKRNPALMKHLDQKAKVSAMTKAASHLLWDDANFSIIRDWLMNHTDWMISDTTGVPPRIAKKFGFVQDVYGAYEGAEPFGTVNNGDMQAFINLFKGATPISFRYGYPDNHSHGHIVVTRKNTP
ncbi:MAG TPA: hypothetical protein VIF62_22270 [Labilithrix sp.]